MRVQYVLTLRNNVRFRKNNADDDVVLRKLACLISREANCTEVASPSVKGDEGEKEGEETLRPVLPMSTQELQIQ